jgi:hypothetical protein
MLYKFTENLQIEMFKYFEIQKETFFGAEANWREEPQ